MGARMLVHILLLSSALLATVSAAPPPPLTQLPPPPNTTLPLQLIASSLTANNAITVPTIYPIPLTHLTLLFTYIGTPWIPLILLTTLLDSAAQSISDALSHHPQDIVWPLPWFHTKKGPAWRDAISIRIRGDGGRALTWVQLWWVLMGLRAFMEGDGERLHPVNFKVEAEGEGMVAAGVLWYSGGRGAG